MVVASGDVRLPRLLRRDARADVDRLYRRHSEEVLRYALLVLRSRDDAEDITQTVFIRALRAIERGEKVRTPRNWLIRITHNECRRLLSSRKLHAELPDEIAVEPAEAGQAEELRAAMAALPDHQRQALVLRELEGRSYAEIAASLELSVSAVETLIFRARRAVREQIENVLACEEFAALLDDPSARVQVRAHARVCADCATLERQARGRKSALKRIASVFGLPWWGAKVAAVALTTAAVAVVAVPHDGTRPADSTRSVKTKSLNPIPLRSNPNLVSHVGGTGLKSFASKRPHARLRVVAAPIKPSDNAPAASRAAAPPAVTPAPPLPDPPPPGGPPLPPAAAAAATPVAAAVAALPVPQTLLPPVSKVPELAVPPVSVPPAPQVVPAVTIPVETPNVSLP